MHKDEPRDIVVRIRSTFFKEMSESELARRFNVDLMIFAQRFGSFGGRCITKRHESDRDSGSEEGKKNV